MKFISIMTECKLLTSAVWLAELYVCNYNHPAVSIQKWKIFPPSPLQEYAHSAEKCHCRWKGRSQNIDVFIRNNTLCSPCAYKITGNWNFSSSLFCFFIPGSIKQQKSLSTFVCWSELWRREHCARYHHKTHLDMTNACVSSQSTHVKITRGSLCIININKTADSHIYSFRWGTECPFLGIALEKQRPVYA